MMAAETGSLEGTAMLKKSLDQIGLADLQQLVTNAVSQGRRNEYSG
jgi:hypothetical protein